MSLATSVAISNDWLASVSGRRVRRRPQASRVAAPAHFAWQIEAASRVAPAVGFRGHSAVVLSCGIAGKPGPLEDAVRGLGPFHSVHVVSLPLHSWREVAARERIGASWLRAYVMREIERCDPDLIVLLDRAGGAEVAGVGAQLRRWGASVPIRVLQLGATASG